MAFLDTSSRPFFSLTDSHPSPQRGKSPSVYSCMRILSAQRRKKREETRRLSGDFAASLLELEHALSSVQTPLLPILPLARVLRGETMPVMGLTTRCLVLGPPFGGPEVTTVLTRQRMYMGRESQANKAYL